MRFFELLLELNLLHLIFESIYQYASQDQESASSILSLILSMMLLLLIWISFTWWLIPKVIIISLIWQQLVILKWLLLSNLACVWILSLHWILTCNSCIVEVVLAWILLEPLETRLPSGWMCWWFISDCCWTSSLELIIFSHVSCKVPLPLLLTHGATRTHQSVHDYPRLIEL